MNNREFLKDFIRGYENLDDTGISPYMWLIMTSGEYDKETLEACKGVMQWYKHTYKIADRESGFYEYLDRLKKQGYDVGDI